MNAVRVFILDFMGINMILYPINGMSNMFGRYGCIGITLCM